MMNRKLRTATYIVLVPAAAITSYAGVLSGLQQGWFATAWFFTISVVVILSVTSVALQQRIEGSFERLAGIACGESDPIRLESRFKPSLLDIVVMIAGVVMFSMSLLAAFREHWLIVCVLLAGTLSANVISSGLIIARGIKAYSEQLEAFISHDREGGTRQDPYGSEMH